MIMTTMSPLLLCIPPLRPTIIKNIRTLHLTSLVGVLSYLVTNPEYRVSMVGAGVSMSCLAWTATWYAERSQRPRLEAKTLAWTSGLILSNVAKFANYTNNPIWPVNHGGNGGWNKTGFALAVLAVLRSTRQKNESRSAYEAKGPQSPILAGLGLAGLFFGLHSLLSDSSTMITWVWTGFPVQGPIAANGVFTILAMGLGLVVGMLFQDSLIVWVHFVVISVGAFLVTSFNDWTGYLGALLLAVSLTAAAPVLISSAARNGASSFSLGFFLYDMLVFGHVWVVAYAFVPGGIYLRERTSWLMTAMSLLIGAGMYAVGNAESQSKTRHKPGKRGPNRLLSYYVYIVAITELLAISISYLRFPTNDYAPHHKDEKLITAGIWTIHFSLDNDMWTAERRIRDLVKELEIDVIGFLESDLQRIIMGNRDTTQYIAEDLGMYVDVGPGPDKHTWGAALLSRFPILNSTHHLLPSPVGELAPAIHATIDAYGQHIDVITFHSGQEEDVEDRKLQSEYLSKLMRESPNPTILLSYLIVRPGEGNYHNYVGEKSGMRDIDATDWDRWCEYILYKGLKRTGYARISRSTITDTELQVGKFVVGQPEGTDEQISESDVPEALRFPALFRGQGVRGHAYHVLNNEPRYYR